MSSIIQSTESAQGRSNKRPQADTPSFGAFDADFAAQNTNSACKRARKASQLHQFRVFKDEISSADKENPSGQNEPTLSLIGRQTHKVWLHISVNISFRPEFHSIPNPAAV